MDKTTPTQDPTQDVAGDLDLTIDEHVFSAPGGGWHEEIVDGQAAAGTIFCTFAPTCSSCRFTCRDCPPTFGC
jgi:hypothetical protein